MAWPIRRDVGVEGLADHASNVVSAEDAAVQGQPRFGTGGGGAHNFGCLRGDDAAAALQLGQGHLGRLGQGLAHFTTGNSGAALLPQEQADACSRQQHAQGEHPQLRGRRHRDDAQLASGDGHGTLFGAEFQVFGGA
jgi:hypothetical protein